MKIAIIGFGFSGAMVAANLVRMAGAPLELFLIAPEHDARGIAYSTDQSAHLLNMRARNMGAFDGDGEHFCRWLASGAGKAAAAAHGLTQDYGEQDFVPRQLYGEYLQAIWKETQVIATQKGLAVRLVPTRAVAIQAREGGLAILTERGDAIAVDAAVLATGHETKPALPQLEDFIVQRPWALGALIPAAASEGPVALLGTGLTAVDMMLSLRTAGYAGQIVALSRRGLLPQPHVHPPGKYHMDESGLLAQDSVSALMRYLRRCVAEHKKAGGEWPAVMDALRPYTQRLWLKRTASQQRSFLRHALVYWNTHRHRMAPQIAARLDAEIASGKLRVIACRRLDASQEAGKIRLDIVSRIGKEKTLFPTAVINCIGPELRLQRTSQPLHKQLLAERLAEPHANGVGLAVDPQCRVYGEAYPRLYAMGSLMTGQFLESTGVPELRAQAATVARQLLGSKP